MDHRDARNMQTRMDHRDIEEFKNDIKVRTQREGILVREWFRAKCDPKRFLLEDAGVDNSGELIVEAAKTSRKPDFSLTDRLSGEKTYIEVKNSFDKWIATFKESDLEFYQKFEDKMIILVFVATGMRRDYEMTPSKLTEWFIIKKKEIPKIMEVGYYEPCGHRGFGGKATYRLSRCQDQFDIFDYKVTNLYRHK
jgi:hypothetical protein